MENKQEEHKRRSSDLREYQQFLENIQLRAKNNALAHREAASHAKQWGDTFTVLNLIFTAGALLFTALSLATTAYQFIIPLPPCLNGFPVDVFFNILGIISAFIALFTQCILLYKHYDVTETMHLYFQNSFNYISQRSREIKRPDFDRNNIKSLVDELERHFALLKARAIEPNDKHFDRAADIQKKINSDNKYEGARTSDLYKQKKGTEETPASKTDGPARQYTTTNSGIFSKIGLIVISIISALALTSRKRDSEK